MTKTTYLDWLHNDIQSTRYALLKAIEHKDYVQYIYTEEIRAEYNEKIGVHEEEVLKLELEVNLLEKKYRTLQMKFNRREKIDIDQINQQIEEERKKIIGEIEAQYESSIPAGNEYSGQVTDELRKLYQEISDSFHPELNSNITDTQKMLFEKASEFYRERKAEELQLVHDMLFDTRGMISFQISSDVTTEETPKLDHIEEILAYSEKTSEDYLLAESLFSNFEPVQQETVLMNSKNDYSIKVKAILAEIEAMYQVYPLSAAETLHNPQLLNEYLATLEYRKTTAQNRINEINHDISELMKKVDIWQKS